MMPHKRHSPWKQWVQNLRDRIMPRGNASLFGWGTVMDAVEDWICIIDLDARIIRSNANCRNLFGVSSHHTIGKTCCSLLHRKSSPMPGCPLQRMTASGKRESAELEIERGKWMLVTVDPIFGPKDNIQGAVHISRDITHRIVVQNEREILLQDLIKAVNQIKTLSGLLPICASCKKIRDDKGYWNLLENYIETHSQASFSHGLCPECMEDIYGQEAWYRNLMQDPDNGTKDG